MSAKHTIAVALAVFSMTAAAHAQPTPAQTERIPGETKVETTKMTGEVVRVSGNWLLMKMQPLGHYALFDVQPGRARRARSTAPSGGRRATT